MRHLAALAAAVPLALGCATHRPATTTYAAPPAAATSWDAVFAAPVAASVQTWETGRVKVKRSLLLDLTQPEAAGVADSALWVPVFAHAVRIPGRGLHLLDTGFDHSFTGSRRGNIGGIAGLVSPVMAFVQQDSGTDLASRLRAAGEPVRGVFFTHLDLDHTAGVPDLPKDIPFTAGPGTLQDSYESGVVVHIDHLRGLPTLREFDFTHAPDLPPLGRAVDVFGDGALWAIATPGHSRGHVSYLVNAASGPVLFVGDASHTRWGFEHGVAPGKATDHAAARESLRRLAAFHRAYPQVRLVFGHERPGA